MCSRENESEKNLFNQKVKISMDLNERKIDCLVANDEIFSLMFVSDMLLSLNCIGRVDQASNG